MSLLTLLGLNALSVAVCFLILWLIACRIKDPSFVDSWWAGGMVVLAWSSFAQSSPGPHRWALTLLATAWGLRLALYLLWRWRQHGPDRRYVSMMAHAKQERGWGFPLASLLLVFALQAPLQFVVALPVQLGQTPGGDGALGPVALGGVALAVLGILFETIGDAQLVAFKAKPENKGKLLTTGLWRYTRHPNYFGDALTWWGLYAIACEQPYGVWSAAGPLLLTFLLTRWSGAPTTEGRLKRTRPEYADYMARTSGFVPWFPRKV